MIFIIDIIFIEFVFRLSTSTFSALMSRYIDCFLMLFRKSLSIVVISIDIGMIYWLAGCCSDRLLEGCWCWGHQRKVLLLRDPVPGHWLLCVHDTMLEDVAEIVGKRIRYRVDGPKIIKVITTTLPPIHMSVFNYR